MSSWYTYKIYDVYTKLKIIIPQLYTFFRFEIKQTFIFKIIYSLHQEYIKQERSAVAETRLNEALETLETQGRELAGVEATLNTVNQNLATAYDRNGE